MLVREPGVPENGQELVNKGIYHKCKNVVSAQALAFCAGLRQGWRMDGQDTPGGRAPWHLVIIFLGWLAVLLALWLVAQPVRQTITGIYLRQQDRDLVLAALGVWAAGGVGALAWGPARRLGLPGWAVALLALALVAGCWAGWRWVLDAYSLSRDERMVVFDAAIYRAGRLAWPMPAEWRVDSPALNLLFTLPVGRPIAWVSAYLPGNALLQAVFGSLKGPLLVGISVLALWGVARRWLDREASVVALVLFVLSGQVLFAGMTVFAMSAHLAVNLVWLWLFLRDDRRSDLAALLVGFVGTGLHQPLFHPMFVAPWLLVLAAQRRWGRLALFCGVYGAIGLFWLWWPHVTLGLVKGPDSVIVEAGSDYWTRLTDTLAHNDQNFVLMAANLFRMAAWTHPLLWVLAAVGAGAAFRDARVAALLGGIVLVLVVFTTILPFQGHGFGYRYMHQVLGNAALLGGFGWQRLGVWRDRLRGGFVVASAATALVLIPMQGWAAHRLYGAFAQTSARIDASGADYMLIGIYDSPLSLDLAYNRADLSNRPIRLSENDIEDVDRLAARICRNGASIALPHRSFYLTLAAAVNSHPGRIADRLFDERASEFADAGCRIIPLR